MNTNLFNLTNVAECKLSYNHKVNPMDRPKVENAQDAYMLFKPFFEEEGIDHHEAMFMLLLNRANRVLGCVKVGQGGVAGTAADVKIMFQGAILANASGFIIAHNHPSGNLKPSQSDIELTKRVKEAGKVLELPLADHLIMGFNTYFSFQDEGLM